MKTRDEMIEEIWAYRPTHPEFEGILRQNDLKPSTTDIRTWSDARIYLEQRIPLEVLEQVCEDIVSVQKIKQSGTIHEFARCLDLVKIQYEGEDVKWWEENYWEERGISSWSNLHNFIRFLSLEERKKILKCMTYITPIYYHVNQELVVKSALRLKFAKRQKDVKPWSNAASYMLSKPDEKLEPFIKDCLISSIFQQCLNIENFQKNVFGDNQLQSKQKLRELLTRRLSLDDLQFLDSNYIQIQSLIGAYYGSAKLANMPVLKKPIVIFISYFTGQASEYQISYIAKSLEDTPDIADALFWQEDCGENIIVYMNHGVARSEVVLVFCNERVQKAIPTDPVTREWTAALGMNKIVIPIFIKENDMPPLLKILNGVYFDPNNVEGTIQKIYAHIIKLYQKREKKQGLD